MAKRGPKQQAAAVRLVRGSRERPRHTGTAPIGSTQPAARSTAAMRVQPPSWLPAAAKKVWTQLRREGVQGALEVLERYCVARSRWEQGVQQLSVQGSVLEAPSGYRYGHPGVKEVQALVEELAALELLLTRRVVPAAAGVQQSKLRFFG